MKRPSKRRWDAGVTLIELLISIAIIGVILGAISSAFIVFFSNADYGLRRDDHSGGAGVLTQYLDRDLASATADAYDVAACSPGGAVNKLLLTWSEASASVTAPSPDPDGGGTFQAAYYIVVEPASETTAVATRYKLIRAYCVDSEAPVLTTLVTNLATANVDFAKGSTGTCGAGSTRVGVVLKRFETDTASDYTYSGCLKGRLGS